MKPRIRQWLSLIAVVLCATALIGLLLTTAVKFNWTNETFNKPTRTQTLIDRLREPVIHCWQEIDNNLLKVKCEEESGMWGEWMLVWEQPNRAPVTSYWSLAGRIGWPFTTNPGSVTIKFRSENLREAELVVITHSDLKDCTVENMCERAISNEN